MKQQRPHRLGWLVCLAAASAASCQTVGDSMSFLSSSLGLGSKSSKDHLADEVRSARSEHQEAQEDVDDAFNAFQRLTAPQAVELPKLAKELKKAVAACEKDAERVRERILSVRTAADNVSTEWGADLESFTSEEMRKKSATMLNDTQKRSERMIVALERVQERMDPVLVSFQDYLLFFGHNLNARAIATLNDTYDDFEDDVQALQKELERARTEMNSFLQAIEGETNS